MLLGLILLFYELYFIPGTSIIGMIGGILCIFSVVLIFRKYGSIPGYITLFLTVMVVFIFIVTVGRNKVWQRISNRNIITSRSNTIEQDEVKPGQKGHAVTDIRKVGTGRINDVNYIVQTEGDIIKKGEAFEVLKVVVTKIFVKTVDNNA
jgi:membrane-bound ClpP family serine protease